MGYDRKYIKGNDGYDRKKDSDYDRKKDWDDYDKDDDCYCVEEHHHYHDKDDKKDKKKCHGCACEDLRGITPGTRVFLTIDGTVQGPFTFASFCHDDCCVTLISGAGVTPSGAVFIVDCNEIDAVSFPPPFGI
ncbi:hypothetical protein ABE178_25320 [Priestia megaterium]